MTKRQFVKLCAKASYINYTYLLCLRTWSVHVCTWVCSADDFIFKESHEMWRCCVVMQHEWLKQITVDMFSHVEWAVMYYIGKLLAFNYCSLHWWQLDQITREFALKHHQINMGTVCVCFFCHACLWAKCVSSESRLKWGQDGERVTHLLYSTTSGSQMCFEGSLTFIIPSNSSGTQVRR